MSNTYLTLYNYICDSGTTTQYIWALTPPIVCPSNNLHNLKWVSSITQIDAYLLTVVDNPYTLYDRSIACDTVDGNIIVNLPQVTTYKEISYIIFKSSASNTVTIYPSESDLIDGSSSKVLTEDKEYIILQNDGISNWGILDPTTNISISENKEIIYYNSQPLYKPFSDTDELTSYTTTTSKNFIQRQRLTTSNLTAGTYKIEFIVLFNGSSTRESVGVQVQVNDTTTLFGGNAFSRETKDSQTNERDYYTGVDYYTGFGVLDIDIDYKTSGGTARIYYSRISIWRVM